MIKTDKNISSYPDYLKKLNSNSVKLKNFVRKYYKKLTAYLLTYPERSFFGLIGIIALLIIAGNIINQPKTPAITKQESVKGVAVYSIGSSPKISVSGKIEKSGVIKIVAQSAGVVQKILKTEGNSIARGAQIMTLSTNYQGGILPAVTRQIAQKNYDFVVTNYDTQKDLIAKRREIATKSNDQSQDLRDITSQSHDDTQNLINLNQEIITGVDESLAYLEKLNSDGSKSQEILQLKQAKSGVLSGQLSLRNALRNTDYQTNSDNPPAQLTDLQKELSLKQLDLEEKALDLNREISRLNLLVSKISESLMYPASPVKGTVERIHVQIGQNVNPGTLLATVNGDKNTSIAVITLPSEIARQISVLESSDVVIGTDKFSLTPKYISSEPTEGSLNTVLYEIPEAYESGLVNGSIIRIDIPIRKIGTNSVMPFVPLDSVYQTQSDAYVFVATKSADGKMIAKSHNVNLGQVYGQYVEVLNGLNDGDQIITDRNVLDDDTVKIN